MNQKPEKHWESHEGMRTVRFPVSGTPEWDEYDKRFDDALMASFGKEGYSLIPMDDLPVAGMSNRNRVVNYDRFDTYTQMAAAGEPFPRIVVEPTAYEGKYHIIDGNHRHHAAKKAGVESMRGYLRVRADQAERYGQQVAQRMDNSAPPPLGKSFAEEYGEWLGKSIGDVRGGGEPVDEHHHEPLHPDDFMALAQKYGLEVVPHGNR